MLECLGIHSRVDKNFSKKVQRACEYVCEELIKSSVGHERDANRSADSLQNGANRARTPGNIVSQKQTSSGAVLYITYWLCLLTAD